MYSPMSAFFLWMSTRIWLCNYLGVTFISSTLVIYNLPQKHTPRLPQTYCKVNLISSR